MLDLEKCFSFSQVITTMSPYFSLALFLLYIDLENKMFSLVSIQVFENRK
jgi:hypothetical protein